MKMVKYPYVIRELCIGCGVCEYKCPLPGEAGIITTGEQALRPVEPDEIILPEPEDKSPTLVLS